MLGVSLGKANYLLRALLDTGLLRVGNFRTSRHKIAYAYLITPRGLAEKAELTRGYLERKSLEYEALREEIERLKAELDMNAIPRLFSSPAEPASPAAISCRTGSADRSS
jgi:EPS-associated MarR family transcriptional regulator